MTTPSCPWCGAWIESGEECQGLFEQCLAREFSDAEFGQVHFLTVVCYLAQHGGYTRAGLLWVRSQLPSVLENPATIRRIRALAPSHAGDYLQIASDPPAAPFPWTVTIASLSGTLEDSTAYCRSVRAWAEALLVDLNRYLQAE